MLIWQIVKSTRVCEYEYDVVNDKRALSIVFLDRASRSQPEESKTHALLEAASDMYVTPAISHPVVEYICTLDIDRCARTQSDIAPTRLFAACDTQLASVPRTRRDPRELRLLVDGNSRKDSSYPCGIDRRYLFLRRVDV